MELVERIRHDRRPQQLSEDVRHLGTQRHQWGGRSLHHRDARARYLPPGQRHQRAHAAQGRPLANRHWKSPAAHAAGEWRLRCRTVLRQRHTEGENGPIRMPSTDEQYLRSSLIVPREEWTRPEHLNRGSFRANLNAVVNPRFDLNVQTMFMRSEARLPQVDNNVNSFYYNALTNPGFHPGPNCAVPAPGVSPCLGYSSISPLGQPLNGWAQFTPADIFQRTRSEGVKRFLGGSTASWRPLPWLQTDGTVGIDLYSERAFQICRLNECPNFGTQRQGSVLDNHLLNRIITSTLRSSARY